MTSKYFSIALVLSLATFGVFAQAPKYSNEFLSIGVGARALGMSNTIVADVDDVTAGYWNPAGLLSLQNDLQIGYMHNEYFAGIGKYDYGAIAARIDETTVVAFTPLLRLAVDDIPNTLDLIDSEGNINYDRVKSFSAADYAFIFSYAKKSAKEGLTYGASAKVIYRKVGEFANAWGFGFDLGAQYTMGKWKFGAMGHDITTTFNAWSFNTEKFEEVFTLTGNEIPQNSLEITLPRLVLGAGRKTNITKKFTFYPEIDLDFTFDGMRNVMIKSDPVSINPHLGIELGYGGFVYLRGGIGYIQQVTDFDKSRKFISQPTMGLGVKIKSFTIDYALTNIAQSVGLRSNVFSIKIDINKKPKQEPGEESG